MGCRPPEFELVSWPSSTESVSAIGRKHPGRMGFRGARTGWEQTSSLSASGCRADAIGSEIISEWGRKPVPGEGMLPLIACPGLLAWIVRASGPGSARWRLGQETDRFVTRLDRAHRRASGLSRDSGLVVADT